MRQEGIEVTFKIPVEFEKPDNNGAIYTREAVEKALCTYASRPILVIDNSGNKSVIGVTSNKNAKLFLEDSKYKIVVDGIINYGGSSENCEVENKIIKDFTITSVGICKDN